MSGMNVEQMQQQQQKMAEAEERRSSLLDQILESAAKDRLTRLALVKKEFARSVEDSLISAATSGKLPGKVNDQQLVAMLEQFSSSDVMGSKAPKKIVMQRRKYGMDDDDDDDDSDLI